MDNRGRPTRENKRIKRNTTLDAEVDKRVLELAEVENRSIASMLRILIEEAVEARVPASQP